MATCADPAFICPTVSAFTSPALSRWPADPETHSSLAACLFFQYYREQANYLERTYDFVERVGIEKVRRDTIYAPEETRRALLERLARAKALSSDPWLERDQPRTRTQFVQIQPMEMVT